MKLDCPYDTDTSSETDSSNENNYSSCEENFDKVMRCCWQIVEKTITFKDAVDMLKDDIKTLKESIYIKRKQDSIKSAYFGNQCFSIFAACCYNKSLNNNDVRNDNVIVVTESSDHDRVEPMSFLQKVFHKIEHVHEKKARECSCLE